MAIYFLDTSAIVKRYIAEPGQAWVLSLCDSAQQHELYISQAALVEVVATICRRAREQSISLPERDRLISVFRQDSKTSYNMWPVTTEVYEAAGDLCLSHRLRAYDAVQLACALALREYALVNQAPLPVFVCADVGLLDITGVVGLQVENPNNYP
jgi:predicted nucleic acid-binding protein